MSKKSAKPVGPVTRRQQVEALRGLKGQEIAIAVAKNIRDAVKQEVEVQLKPIRDTMLDLIDRVLTLEQRLDSNGDDRQPGEETPPSEVPDDDEVVPDPCDYSSNCGCSKCDPDDASG